MDKLKFVIPFLVLTTLVLVGAGCGGDGTPGVPTTDVSGEDIPDVSRYPGSVRIYYGPVPGTDVVVVEYLTSASIETVSDFYEAQLPADGWQLPGGEEMIEGLDLAYIYVGQGLVKKGQQTIVLVRESTDYPGYTNINITFGPQ
jgi:hypothetical protein